MSRIPTAREIAIKHMTEDSVAGFDEISEAGTIGGNLHELIRPHILLATRAAPPFSALGLKLDDIVRLAVEGKATVQASMLLTGYPHPGTMGIPEQLGVSIHDIELHHLRVSDVARATGIEYHRMYRIAYDKRPGTITPEEVIAILAVLAA